MGYDVHITRAEHWTESQAKPITLAEWIAYVESDPEMRLDDAAEVTAAMGETVRYGNDGIAVWTAYSGHGIDGNMAWFDYREGRVVVKNPDDEICRKMYSIASALGALVQGDEGERYGQSASGIRMARQARQTSPSRQPWWKRILRMFASEQPPITESAVAKAPVAPFAPGQRVKDPWGNRGTVIEVDPAAEHGLGRICVRYDDGREVTAALAASGLELLTEPSQAGG